MNRTSTPASADLPGAGLSGVTLVRVGSENAAKLEAVRSAFAEYASELRIEGVSVASGVAEQPVGFDEIVRGARNRAAAAYRTGPCSLAVGIEDGLIELPGVVDAPLNVGAAVVTDGQRDSVGLSSAFAYPPGCRDRALAEREPIGDLFDAQWDAYAAGGAGDGAPSGRGIGNIGKLSLGVLTRSEYGRHAVLCALLQFLHPKLYTGQPAEPGPISASTSHSARVSNDE